MSYFSVSPEEFLGITKRTEPNPQFQPTAVSQQQNRIAQAIPREFFQPLEFKNPTANPFAQRIPCQPPPVSPIQPSLPPAEESEKLVQRPFPIGQSHDSLDFNAIINQEPLCLDRGCSPSPTVPNSSAQGSRSPSPRTAAIAAKILMAKRKEEELKNRAKVVANGRRRSPQGTSRSPSPLSQMSSAVGTSGESLFRRCVTPEPQRSGSQCIADIHLNRSQSTSLTKFDEFQL
jgi:hypothetical protein